MALGSCQFRFLQEPKGQSRRESSIMRTLAKVSSFNRLRQAHPRQIAPAAPSYGLHVFSAGPWGWHGEGEHGPRRTSQGDRGDIRKRGNMCQRWLCVARRNRARKGGKTRFSFSG